MTSTATHLPAVLLARRAAMIEAVATVTAQPGGYVEGIVDAAMAAAAPAVDSEDPGYARQLMAAGIISASAAQRALADKAHHNGKAEHLDFAEWLEDFATSLLHLSK